MLSPPLYSSKVTLKYSSLDRILEKEHPTAHVILENKFGLAIDVNVKIQENNFFKVYTNIFYNNKKVDICSLHAKDLLDLVSGYYNYAGALNEDRGEHSNQNNHYHRLYNMLHNIRSFIEAVKDVRSIRRIFRYLLQNQRSLNVCTINGLKDTMLAKTTIELDADVITIILPEVLKLNSKDVYLQLHEANIYIANFLFSYPIKKYFSFIKKTKILLRTITPSLWVVLSLYPFIASDGLNNLDESYNLLYLIMNTFGIPTVLFRSVPKLIGIVVRKTLLRDLHI